MAAQRQADSPEIAIRPATPDDVEFVYAMIVGLAEYEREPDAVTGTPELLRTALFGGPDGRGPYAEALIATLDGERVGFAVFHGTFSTWECLPGIWLEDLYVMPEHRRYGLGEALFRAVAAIAVERGCTRYGWVALDWNEPALGFYAKHGAALLDEWKVHRLSGESLRALAAGDPSRK